MTRCDGGDVGYEADEIRRNYRAKNGEEKHSDTQMQHIKSKSLNVIHISLEIKILNWLALL